MCEWLVHWHVQSGRWRPTFHRRWELENRTLDYPRHRSGSTAANEGYWASMHEWSNIEGHAYDGDLKPLSYLWSNEAFDWFEAYIYVCGQQKGSNTVERLYPRPWIQNTFYYTVKRCNCREIWGLAGESEIKNSEASIYSLDQRSSIGAPICRPLANYKD